MARIIPLQTKITLHQAPTQSGSYYPACIFANDTFIAHFENSLITTKQLLETGTEIFSTIENILTGLSQYRIWKYNKEKKETPFTDEIKEHFALLPGSDCNIEMLFKPYNDVPTDALLYSHDEVVGIVNAMKMAIEKADAEQAEVIQPIFDSFNSFLNDWQLNQQATGSYFANEKNV